MRYFAPVNPQLANLIRNHSIKNEMGKGVFRRNTSLSRSKKNTNFVLQSIPNKTISSVHYYNDYIRIKIFSEIKTNAHVNMG